MMKLLTKVTALLLCVCAMLVTALPARGAGDPYRGKTLNFSIYCVTEDAMRTLVDHLAAGGEVAANKFYMAESTPCYSLSRRAGATVIRVAARVPLPENAVALVLEVRVHGKAGLVVYVFMVVTGSVPKNTKDPGSTPALQGDQRDI